jgi:ABC-2 type transport system permease protein
VRFASIPFRTLLGREVERFLSVATQTVFTPLVSSLLYLLIFGLSLGDRLAFHGVPYVAFLVPGLVMMGVLNNSFQNTTSSIMISKFEGNIVELLVAPISYLEMTFAYALGGVARGLAVGGVIWLATLPFTRTLPVNPFFTLAVAALASFTFALLGILAAIWAERWDGVSAVSSFVILPLTYLGGVFYSLDILPPLWRSLSRFNPMLYMVDGLRYGFLGVSDVHPAVSFLVTGTLSAILFTAVVLVFRSGWKLRA